MATGEEFQMMEERRHILNTRESFLSTGESQIERFPSRENLLLEDELPEDIEMQAQFLANSFAHMEELEEVEEQPSELTEDMIAEGLSQLGRSADGAMQVFLTLFLPGYNIANVEPLAEYIHLQTVVLSYNKLTDLSPLGCMPNLISLDVSHNEITEVLNFTPPLGLREVNYSHNLVEHLPDLSAHHSLTTLILDYNQIMEIKGLSTCKRLSLLTMTHNNIQKISGLDHLPLKKLDLSHNSLKKIEGLDTLKYIETINLSGNSIRSLKGLQNHHLLTDINLEENQVIDVAEIRYIRELPLLRSLNLSTNPIQSLPDYRLSLLFRIQSLSELDKAKVSPEEKVAAINLFNPPSAVDAARDHMLHVVRSLLQPSKIYESTLPSLDTPYPMLILTGPAGSGKRQLTKKLCQEFPDFFGYGVSHTTRPPRKKEEEGLDYHFVSLQEFERAVMAGEFLQTCQSGGNLYGVTRQAVEGVAREGLAGIFHMELEGVLSFKNTYFEPRYVLILPQTREQHEKHLRETGYYSEAQIAYELDRVEVYAETNREKPGFFDSVIVSDDTTEAYRRLKRVIMEYLGLSPAVSTESTFTSSFAETLTSGEVSDHEYSTTSGSVKLPGKSFSRRSEPMSNTSRKNMSRTPAQIQSVEQSSIERRQILAKAAVAGLHSLPQEQLENIRQSLSADASKAKSRLQSSDGDYQARASTAPVKYNNSNFSVLANEGSNEEENELGIPRAPSVDSESNAASGRSSSILSSAHAYSAGGTQISKSHQPHDGYDKTEAEDRPESTGSADVSLLSDTPVMVITSNSI